MWSLLPLILKLNKNRLSFSGLLIMVNFFVIRAQESLKCSKDFEFAQQEQMQYHLDVTQKPCDDFYEYACGNWRVKYPLRMLNATDTLSAIKASNKHMLIQYLEGDGLEEKVKETTTHQQVVNFYKSCIERRAWKSKAQNERILQQYTDVLKSFVPMWPILNGNYEPPNKTIEWEYIAAEMRRYGVQAFLRVMMQANWQSGQQLIFYIVPPTFEWLKRHRWDSKYDEDTVFLYQRYIKSLIMDFGIRVRKANQVATEIIEFEKDLLNLVNDQQQSMILREPQTLRNLSKEIPKINFQLYFSTLFKGIELPATWPEDLMVVIDNIYLQRLAEFLNHSSSDTIAKYFFIQFLIHFELNLHDDESYTKQKVDCLQMVNDFLPDNLSQLFLELQHNNSHEFLQQTRTHLTETFNKLKKQFEKMLNTSVVFERDPSTKVLSLDKLNDMRLLIPEVDIKALTNVSLSSNNYDLNIIKLWQIKTERELNPLIKQLTESKMTSLPPPPASLTTTTTTTYDYLNSYGPLDVNAYYRLKKNAIELPIGLLRTPIYHACLKPAQLYGSFAYILAHELIHGFDYDGVNYDSSGTVTNSWGVKAMIKFGVRSTCYMNERYKNAELNINENIADTEGLRLALETFLDQEMSAAFDMDDMKLFFTSFAQTWCGMSSASNSLKLLHAGHKERVNNVLGNFMEFSDTFKCKPGVGMHPEEKCRIW